MNIENDVIDTPELNESSEQQPQQQEKINFAPFSLMSCRKVFNSRGMPRKKIHTFIYSIIMVGLISAIGLTALLIFVIPRDLTRSDLICATALIVITLSIISAIKRSRTNNIINGWSYYANLFITTCIRAVIYSSIILFSIIGGTVYLKANEIAQWHIDDVIMLTEIIFIYLIWDGSKYFRKEY